MKYLTALFFSVALVAGSPTTPINNLVPQLNGVSQTGVLAGQATGAATATGAQISTALDLIGSTRGGILYRGVAGWSLLAPGTSGYVLTSAGAGADPTWTAEGHTGTVTSFSAGDLSPLFTTSVATATTTPALTFALSNAGANSIYAGPTSGSPAPPTFRALVAADLPVGTGDVVGPASATNNALAQFDGTTGKLIKSPTDLTYSTPTLSVPDAFVVSSAGSIGLTAGGSGKSIAITSTGNVTLTQASGGLIDFSSNGVTRVLNSSDTTTSSGGALRVSGGIGVAKNIATDGTVYASSGFQMSTGAPSSASSGGLTLKMGVLTASPSSSTDAWIAVQNTGGPGVTAGDIIIQPRSNVAAAIRFITGNGTPALAGYFNANGTLTLNAASRTLSAWGFGGPSLTVPAATFTDSSSSGTVATAVANSFAVPTFAASSSTTFTNAATLYIAGDVANGTNVTLTNSYGLWNAGKTRLDGTTVIGGVSIPTFVSNTNLLVNRGATISFFASTPTLYGRRSQGSLGSESAVGNGNTLLAIGGSGYDGSAYSEQNALLVVPTETWSGTAHGTQLQFYTTSPTTTTNALRFIIDGTATTTTLTGGAGNMTLTAGTGNSRTLTLQTTTSGGTATNAVVFSATQSATFNGPIIQKSSALTYASPTSVDVTLGNVYTVTTVNATGSVTFNASAGGTAGQSMTILITNDATSAKTITFGTNFLSTGTLTASAASRHTSITFCSNGTSWFETGRAVMTN